MLYVGKYGSSARRGILFAAAIVLSGAFALMVACTSDSETETAIVETGEPEVKAVATDTQSESDAAAKITTQRPLRFTRTPTFTVTSTFTATATHTPVPTDTPSPEPTSTYTPTPTPTAEPTPTNTSTPVPTPTETPVPPTSTPSPTATPTSTATPTDTATPVPTDTPEADLIATLDLIDELIKLSTALVELSAMSIEEWDRNEVDALISSNASLMERVAELEAASEGKRSPELDQLVELARLNEENIQPLRALVEASPEPTATHTPEPTATSTPEPSPTPTDTPTPTPEPTDTPTPTPTPTITPTPTPEPITDLTLRWTFQTGASGSVATTASNADLTVRDGVVYAGSKDNKIYAIYASSGQEKWSYNTGSDVTSGGVLSEDGAILYFGTDHTGFFALDTDDGSRRWCYRCDEDDRSDSFETKPTIYEDMVIAPANGRVYAFNADRTSEDEGRLLWANPRIGQDPEDWRFIEAGTAHRDAFYIGNGQADSDGTLHGFHTDTGGRNGNARLRGTQMPYCQEDEDCRGGGDDLEPLRTAVVRNGPDIYFGNDAGELIQYTSNTVSWVFTTASKRNVRGDIAATEEIVVFSDRSGAIYAVNPDREEATKRTSGTGKKPERLWVESTEERRWIAGGPVISGDYVYVIDSHGLLYMIDLERGDTRYTLDLWPGDDPCVSCRSTPAIEDDMLFVGTQDGTIVGVQLPIYAD